MVISSVWLLPFFPTVLWVGLQCVIVVFHDHTHLLVLFHKPAHIFLPVVSTFLSDIRGNGLPIYEAVGANNASQELTNSSYFHIS